MLGIVYLAVYEISGALIAGRLFAKYGKMTRLWLGLTLGCAMLMWFPSLFAFAMGFTMGAQLCAVALAVLLGTGTHFLLKPHRALGSSEASAPPAALVWGAVIPFLIVMAYMQYTHTLLPEDGALFVGQSTYGDLNLHLGIATGLVNASYPPEYTILPGTLLGYPFLMDAASSSLYMMGLPLRWAFIVPGVLMSGLVFWGFVMFSWELTKSWRAVLLSYLLLFLNGGLGFAYVFDLVGRDSSALVAVFTEFYKAPANLLDLNVRWVNVMVDMMLPQRTLLSGWLMVIPALWLLSRCLKEKDWRLFLCLGIWAGAMPMVHTHSFMALGLISVGVVVCAVLGEKKEKRLYLLACFGAYGVSALVLALPQLLVWTFPQTVGGGSLHFRFNWANWQNGALVDEYFWFWVKNVGLVYIVMVPAARYGTKRQRMLAVGALIVYIVAELIQFQPNEYDNNKLFYVAFIVMLPMVANYLVALYDHLKGLPGRRLIAGVFIAVSLCSGTLSVARECVSKYQLYGASEVKAVAYIEENTPEHAVFLTGVQHNNAVSSLSGRSLVCGTSSFLYFHGVDYSAQRAAVKLMFEEPENNLELFETYNVDYIYISSWERSNYAVDEESIAARWPLIFEEGSVRIYAVSARAREDLAG